jgi:hypothetical protein
MADRLEINTHPDDEPQLDADGKPIEKADDTLILGKFKTAEDLEKAYVELEKKQSQGQDTNQDGTPKPTVGIPTVKDEPGKGTGGLDIAGLTAEFGENGELSQGTYKKLAAKGLDKETVDLMIDGQMSRAREYAGTLAQVAGGQEQLDSLFAWAGGNKTPEQVAALNQVFEGNNLEAAKMTLMGLAAEHAAAVASGKADPLGEGDTRLVEGETAMGVTGAMPFRSQAEVTAAMRDPRYENDPAYRKDVMNRLAVTE